MGIKCSIIIPAYNAEKCIIDGINSIELEREWKYEVEVIVINDGSTDLTHEIVSGISGKCKKVTLIDQENAGVSCARNTGIQAAKGEYLYFMDADDTMKRHSLDDMIDCAMTTSAQLVIADYIVYDRIQEKQRYITSKIPNNQLLGKDYIKKILNRFFVGDTEGLSSLCNKLFRREIVIANSICFDEKRTHGEDWRFVIAYMESVECICAINKEIYVYSLDGSQTYSKYKKGLAYSLLDGHRILEQLNCKYFSYDRSAKPYMQFEEKFYAQILMYLSLQECSAFEKKLFIKNSACKETFVYVLTRTSHELQQMQLSRKDKLIAGFLLIGKYQWAFKILDKIEKRKQL